MRGRRTWFRVNLLELKALVEIVANTDAYYFNTGNYSIGKRASQYSEMGMHAFSLFQHLPLSQLKDYFAEALGVEESALYNQLTVDDFFDQLGDNSFIEYVTSSETKQFMCTFEYLAWSEKDCEAALSCLFKGSGWQSYVAHLRTSVIDLIHTELICKGTRVLSLYSRLPMLQKGLIMQIRSKASRQGAQPDLVAACNEFALSSASLSFEYLDGKNDTTVIEKYLGRSMDYFIPNWLSTLSKNYTVAPAMMTGDDGSRMYRTDRANRYSPAYAKDVDVYALFQLIKSTGYRIGARRKAGKNVSFMLPYFTIVDIYLQSLEAPAFAEVFAKMSFPGKPGKSNNPKDTGWVSRYALLSRNRTIECPKTQPYELFIRREVEYDGTDSTFKDSRNRFRDTVSRLCETCKVISIDNYLKELSRRIVQGNPQNVKDANIALFDTSAHVDSDLLGTVFSDSCYRDISELLKCLGELAEFDHALAAYGTDLATVWTLYLMKNPTQNLSVISNYATIPSFLEYLGLNSPAKAYDVFNDPFTETGRLNIELTAEQYNMLLRALNCPPVVLAQRNLQNIGTAELASPIVTSNVYTKVTEFIGALAGPLAPVKSRVSETYRAFCGDILHLVSFNVNRFSKVSRFVVAPKFVTEAKTDAKSTFIALINTSLQSIASLEPEAQQQWIARFLDLSAALTEMWRGISSWCALPNPSKGQPVLTGEEAYLTEGNLRAFIGHLNTLDPQTVTLQSPSIARDPITLYISSACIAISKIVITTLTAFPADGVSLELMSASFVAECSILGVSVLDAVFCECSAAHSRMADILTFMQRLRREELMEIRRHKESPNRAVITYNQGVLYWTLQYITQFRSLNHLYLQPLMRITSNMADVDIDSLLSSQVLNSGSAKGCIIFPYTRGLSSDQNSAEAQLVDITRSFIRMSVDKLCFHMFDRSVSLMKLEPVLRNRVRYELGLDKLDLLAVQTGGKKIRIDPNWENLVSKTNQDYQKALYAAQNMATRIRLRDRMDTVIPYRGYYHRRENLDYLFLSVDNRQFHVTVDDICIWFDGREYVYLPLKEEYLDGLSLL